MKVLIISSLLLMASCSASLHGAVSSQYKSEDHLGQYSYGYADPNSQKHETRSADGVTHGGYSYVDGHGLVQSVKYTADPHHGFQVSGTNLPKGPTLAHAIAPVHAVAHYTTPAVSYSNVAHDSHASHPLNYAAPWGYDAPHDTPEVAAAKIAHFAAHAKARAQHHLYKRSITSWGPHAEWSHSAAPIQIHNGVPVDTPEVQHAKAAHFAAHAAVSHGHYAPSHYGYATPVIHNGVPVDTPEVQHARASHLAAFANAGAHHGAQVHYEQSHHGHYGYHGPIHIPVIHNGVPVDTPEVQHARAAHFSAVAKAKGHGGYGYNGW